MNSLEQLKQYSVVVADTGEIDQIAKYKPQDATTNPSLLLKGVKGDSEIVQDALAYAINRTSEPIRQIRYAADKLAVNVGREILQLIPGRVSTEVPAKLSHDTMGTIRYACDLISMYEDVGVDPDRVLIKIASTEEGIKAASDLEKEGIHCNLTLLFSLDQALAAADASVTLISPFVGRIYDWHMQKEGRSVPFAADEDPGVASVRTIYENLKRDGYKTEIMGASFRNVEQVLALAGCDLLTISPKVMDELQEMDIEVKKELPYQPDAVQQRFYEELSNSSQTQRMASEKLSEGIERFAADATRLENILAHLLAQ
jgi:transaldolase